jgi:hypothetical protein
MPFWSRSRCRGSAEIDPLTSSAPTGDGALPAARPCLGRLSPSPRLAGLRQRLAVIVTHPHESFAPSLVGGALRPGLRALHRRARQPGALQ